MVKKGKYFSLSNKDGLKGHLFLLPFYVGLIVFFLGPAFQSVSFAFHNVVLDLGSYNETFVGLDNFKYVFFQDPEFTTNMIDSFVELLWKLPVILIASVFFATILNHQFPGRTFVRAVFFLPVIIASGMVLNIVQGDFIAGKVLSGSLVAGGEISQSTAMRDFLVAAGLSDGIIKGIISVSDSMFNTMWMTGIQTVIFLAGLQSIPSNLYEAASVEGASAWESFWKITIPMLLPIMLVNIIYSIVEYFTSTDNMAMKQIINNTSATRFGWASAMAWSYFLLIAFLLFILMAVFIRLSWSSVRGGGH